MSRRIQPGPRCGFPEPDRCGKPESIHQAHQEGETRTWGFHDTQCQVPSGDPRQYPECGWIDGHQGGHDYQWRIGTPERQIAEREAGK